MESLPETMAVIGLGVIGLELGQALHRMGVKITGIDQLKSIGRLDDEDTNQAAIEILGKELPLWLGEPAEIAEINGKLKVTTGEKSVEVDKVLLSIGRRPNLANLDLEKAGISLNKSGIPEYDLNTMQIKDHPVFIAGDVNSDRPLLHEASDEGRIAGYNAVAAAPVKFRRKTPLSITFTDPNIVSVGRSSCDLDNKDIVTASVKFGPLGRALIMGKNRGLLKLFASKREGQLLGASMVAPHGEHLGHLLAWSIEQKLTVLQMLRMPFYHPVIEEALQPVLRDLLNASDLDVDAPAELERIS
jgi:dihydrolipoamide dehydrogenase